MASSVLSGGPDLLPHVLSTITSPAFSKVIIFYREYNFRGVQPDCYPVRPVSEVETAEDALWHHRRFEVFREMHKARNFRLVLCVDVLDCMGGYAMQVLERAIAAEKAKGGFDSLFPEPLLIYRPRRFYPRFSEDFTAGSSTPWTML